MAITVGTDTYITILEADAYLESTRLSTDAQLIVWAALSDGDKEIMLRNSTYAIERIKFTGKKNDSDQTLAFPRDIAGVTPLRRNPGATTGTFYDSVLYSLLPTYPYDPASINVWIINDEVQDEIKRAEAEEALELASPSGDTAIYEAARGAVKSYRIGSLGETFKDTPSRTQNNPVTVLRSTKAQEFVSMFLGGAYRVI